MAFDDLTPSQREPLIALIEALATGDYHDEFAMSRRATERRGDIHLYGKGGAKDRQLEGFTDSDTQVLIEEGYLSRLGLKATLKAKAYQQNNLLREPSDLAKNMTDSVDIHLRRLLKVYHTVGGSQSKGVVLIEVFKDEDLSESDSWKEADYMEGEGWIAVLADNGPPYVRLTHQGIKRAEAALATEKDGSEDERRNTAASKPAAAIPPMPNATDTRNVFVVHGRNLEARNSLFRFLRSISLRPLEWSQAIEMTGKASPFIGQILDVAFSNAQAVVVLMTPDDVAQLQEQFRSPHDPPYEAHLTGQARPNVLFEAGMAMGRDPDRTVIVELGTLRPFSDIAGRHTVRIGNDSKARQELAQRLQTAGCAVDLSGRDWHTEGDFDLGAHPTAPEPSRTTPGQLDEHDERLFGRFLSAFPSRGKEVRFLRDHDVGVDFPSTMLDPFYDFIERWGNAEHEFNNSELEERRLEFWNTLNTFLRELGQYTSENRGGWLSIGLRDLENRDEMLEAHPRLNDLGTKAYEAHQNLVRAGRRIGISVATE